jgi:hypothetical protein
MRIQRRKSVQLKCFITNVSFGQEIHTKLKDTGGRARGFERLYFLANSGAEYKPARKNLVRGLQRRKYGGNMEILQQGENLVVAFGRKDLKRSSKHSSFIS